MFEKKETIEKKAECDLTRKTVATGIKSHFVRFANNFSIEGTQPVPTQTETGIDSMCADEDTYFT